MKKIIRDYLTFNKRERNGVFVLVSIIILLIVYLNISHIFIKEETVDFSQFEKEIELLQGSVQTGIVVSKDLNEKKTLEIASGLFNFNPNNLPDSDWKKLGLSEKQIHTIKNYEAKGGRFSTKDDVKKMYCISEKLFTSLEPYIQIPKEKEPVTEIGITTFTKDNKTLPIEINSADSIQLVKLKGIGAFYAKTIIKYRDVLGGFIDKEQLKEVWKMDQEKYDAIKDQITVDHSKIKKININTCTAVELKHPYLKWNQVNGIINYRAQHGKYKSIEDIKETDLIDDATLVKIKFYLITE